MEAVKQALAVYRAMDPKDWDTGLSPAGMALGVAHATRPLLDGDLGWPEDLVPPKRLVIWCAGNVFTAPLEWAATFAAAGSEVVLKAPSGRPAPVAALAWCLRAQGLPVTAHAPPHERAWTLLEGADAVLGFGSDSAMLALNAHLGPHVRRALFGHRVSAAVVAGVRDVGRLVEDAVLYDGRGCKSPVAVFALAEAEEVAEILAAGLATAAEQVPRGALEPAWGPRWRRRTGLSRVLARCLEGPDWAVPILPPEWFEPEPLPRMLPVHPVEDLDAVSQVLAGLPLGSCGTNLDAADAELLQRRLGFPVLSQLGAMHATALDGWHEDTDIRATLGEARRP